jgi:hypothetical protein
MTDGARGPLSSRQPAPEGSGVLALRLLSAVAEDDVGMIHFGASFLIAERSDGVCLVDRVHDWDARPSYVEVDLKTRWEQTPAGHRVQLVSERVMHEPLDESESAEGVSDVRSRACQHRVYDTAGGRFSRVEQRLSAGPCTTE